MRVLLVMLKVQFCMKHPYTHRCDKRDKRGWPLLTVETEANGDSKSTNERGSFLGWFVGLVVPVQEIFVLPWLL
jgi:hypothetical protein